MIKIFLGIIIVILAVMNFNNYTKTMELEEKIKTQNEIIEIDNQLIKKHERELELYGDFIVGIARGEDRLERLSRKDVLEAGAKMMEIKEEIEILFKTRRAGDLNGNKP